MKLGRLCACLFVVHAAFLGRAAVAQTVVPEAELRKLVGTQTGELPIILSAPHGGNGDVPMTDLRKGEGIEKGPRGFVNGRDVGTEELCADVAAALEVRLKKKPYFVISRFHRKYIDPNRPAEIAYEDPDAKPYYDFYHSSLATYCKEVQQKYRRGLLLDLHGQASSKETVYRGTQNGKTVTLLRERFGEPAHMGPQSLFGTLNTLGWKTHPLDDGKEQAGFTGGFIVQTYGSHQGFGIDAIQLEFGADYRTPEVRKKTASVLAEAVEAYRDRYLIEKP